MTAIWTLHLTIKMPVRMYSTPVFLAYHDMIKSLLTVFSTERRIHYVQVC